jgi:predicted HTH transcriptional regulator
MSDRDINLSALISEGESETLEFKEKLPPENIISTILAAFANTKGGTLIIGVGDKGEIIGLTKDEATVSHERLQRVARSLLSEPFESGITSLNGRWLVYATVEEAPKHLSPVITATGEDFVRAGTTEDIRAGGAVQTKGPSTRTYTAFVAMSFRQEEEPALVDYYRAMERATLKTRFSVKMTRIDLVEGDYEISQKLMDEIDKADIILTDFTLRPSNVYFELGYARGRRKRIIQIARKDTVLEFDIRNWRTIFYRNATELEEKLAQALDTACSELANTNRRSG